MEKVDSTHRKLHATCSTIEKVGAIPGSENDYVDAVGPMLLYVTTVNGKVSLIVLYGASVLVRNKYSLFEHSGTLPYIIIQIEKFT